MLDGELVRSELRDPDPGAASVAGPLLEAMALDRQPHQDLMALYQGWMDCLTAAEAARLTGNFRPPHGPTAPPQPPHSAKRCAPANDWNKKRRACAARPPRNDRPPSRWTGIWNYSGWMPALERSVRSYERTALARTQGWTRSVTRGKPVNTFFTEY